jgi:2-polyprenyl-6-methoxyphenol hydroxylase-like FAD-dependent oxidoreductase
MRQYSILIIGAGPVGMVLASRLKYYKIDVRILDKKTGITQGSKALSINSASLEVFDKMGIVDKFLERGRKIQHINVYWNGKRFAHINFSTLKSSYPYYLALPQPETETILAENLAMQDCHIERNLTVMSVQHIKDGAEVVILNNMTHEIEINQYDYVIGCDGCKSTVRSCLGWEFTGYNYPMYFLIIDVRLKWSQCAGKTHYYVKEDGFIIIIPLIQGVHRIVIKGNDKDLVRMNKKRNRIDYQEMIDYLGPGNIYLETLLWESKAPFYNRLSEKYREQRVFIAGDAAHLFSPIGGLGMNTGIQDAYNLAWKLAGVINAKFESNILNDYESERLHLAKKIIQDTDGLTRLITRVDTDTNGSLQCWFPTMKNRTFMRQRPLNFSGLSDMGPDIWNKIKEK